jgi:ribosomal protein S8E
MNVAINNFKTKIIRVTPTVSTSAYTANNVLFATTAVPISVTPSSSRGTILGVSIVDRVRQPVQTITLTFLRSNVALGSLNAPVTMTNTNALEIVGQATVTTSVDLANSRYGETQSLSIPFDVPGGSLWVAAQTSGTPTFSAADAIRLRVAVQVESVA